MTRAKIGIIALWIISVLLAIAFVLAATPKLLRISVWIDKFDGWGYAPWFLVVIGGLEVNRSNPSADSAAGHRRRGPARRDHAGRGVHAPDPR